MLITEDELRDKCKLVDITAIEAEILAVNVELERDIEDFIYLCKACNTSVIFYQYKYYLQQELIVNEKLADSEFDRLKDYKELRHTIEKNVKAWNSFIESQAFDRQYELHLVASIDGVVVKCSYIDDWL